MSLASFVHAWATQPTFRARVARQEIGAFGEHDLAPNGLDYQALLAGLELGQHSVLVSGGERHIADDTWIHWPTTYAESSMTGLTLWVSAPGLTRT